MGKGVSAGTEGKHTKQSRRVTYVRTEEHPDGAGASTPEVRWTKIQQLQSAIASGSYGVSSEELADCLLCRPGLWS